MRKEYDFSKAVKGKFYVAPEEMEMPIYLDRRLRRFYAEAAERRHIPLNDLINGLLKKEMEIHKDLVSSK